MRTEVAFHCQPGGVDVYVDRALTARVEHFGAGGSVGGGGLVEVGTKTAADDDRLGRTPGGQARRVSCPGSCGF